MTRTDSRRVISLIFGSSTKKAHLSCRSRLSAVAVSPLQLYALASISLHLRGFASAFLLHYVGFATALLHWLVLAIAHLSSPALARVERTLA